MMTSSDDASSNKISKIARLYGAMVVLVFSGLMVALFTSQKPNESKLSIADEDIVAIVEEYQGDRVSRVSVSLDELETIVPAPSAPAWVMNSASVSTQAGLPKIAIIIDDLGLDREASARLTALRGPYTFAFLPYANGLKEQTQAARSAGHELMVHLPMQSHSDEADPGDNALLKGLSFEEFSKRIEWNLDQFEGFVGINNHMGSLVTEDPALMVRVMARLRSEGLLFVDSLTTPKSMGKKAAKALDVPFVARDIFLDNERSADYINRQLATTEKIARLRGYAIAIGHPYDVTIDTLEEWQKTLEFKGIQLVPISQIMSDAIKQDTLSR